MTNITVNDFNCLIESGFADVTIILKYLRETYDEKYFSNINDLNDIQLLMDNENDIIKEFYACLASDYSYNSTIITDNDLISLYNNLYNNLKGNK